MVGGGSRLDLAGFALCNLLPEALWSLETGSICSPETDYQSESLVAIMAVGVPGIGAFPETPMRFSPPLWTNLVPSRDRRLA